VPNNLSRTRLPNAIMLKIKESRRQKRALFEGLSERSPKRSHFLGTRLGREEITRPDHQAKIHRGESRLIHIIRGINLSYFNRHALGVRLTRNEAHLLSFGVYVVQAIEGPSSLSWTGFCYCHVNQMNLSLMDETYQNPDASFAFARSFDRESFQLLQTILFSPLTIGQ
jgi:hypothetical protein